MKRLLPLYLLPLLFAGCVNQQSRDASFQSLHGIIEQRFADTCKCSPVTHDDLVISNELFVAPLFEITPNNSTFKVFVMERAYYSQAEGERLGTNAADQLLKYITATNLDSDAAMNGYSDATNIILLPLYSYKKTDVDVELRPATLSSSIDADNAYHIYRTILEMLKPY